MSPPPHWPTAWANPSCTTTLAAALYVAALRELFEEAGVLFERSRPPAGRRVARRLAGMVGRTRCSAWHATALVPWSRWITPRMAALSKKRFDTRFFLAMAPQRPDRQS